MTFSSSAFINTSARGFLNFFGETQIQSQLPDNGYAPDVSRNISTFCFLSSLVSNVRSCISGSPPVITTLTAPDDFTHFIISGTATKGCFVTSQLSFTSHHTHPTSQPPRRIK